MTTTGVTDRHVQTAIEDLLRDAPEGEPLSALEHPLIAYGVHTSVVVLDIDSAHHHAVRALEHGATVAQLQEVAALVTGLGLHTLMAASQDLVKAAESQGHRLPEIDHRTDELWQRYVASSAYWHSFQDKVPGFLDALRRLSPHSFETFFQVGALTFRANHLPRRTIELAAIAADTIPQHRFLPGLALHVEGALRAGAGRRQIREAVDVGRSAPPPAGVGLLTNGSDA